MAGEGEEPSGHPAEPERAVSDGPQLRGSVALPIHVLSFSIGNLGLNKYLAFQIHRQRPEGQQQVTWVVARVCSEYIQYCARGVVNGMVSNGHRDNTVSFLNDLGKYYSSSLLQAEPARAGTACD